MNSLPHESKTVSILSDNLRPRSSSICGRVTGNYEYEKLIFPKQSSPLFGLYE